jgi:hypothetical protein
MSETPPPREDEALPPARDQVPPAAADRRHRWDAFGVIIASLVGLLALVVSGYTAWIQRQQVRAEVWPYLFLAFQDPDQQVTVFNKGMGPAIVRGVRVTVDDRPQPDWEHAFAALGLPDAGYQPSTISGVVLSPGDALTLLKFAEQPDYARFRKAMDAHLLIDICYCSTLGECWTFEDHHPPVKPVVRPMDRCPRLPAAEAFRN